MSTLKEDINKVIESLKEAEDFTITQVGDPDPETGAITSVVKYEANLGNLYDEINSIDDSVNTPAINAEIQTRDGKPGDIRVVKDLSYSFGYKTASSGYFLEAKTDDGWVRQYMDRVEHSGLSREGTIPMDMIKWETKRHIKQGDLSFWKAAGDFKPNSNLSAEVYIDEDIVVGKNTPKVLYFNTTTPTIKEKSGLSAIYWDGDASTLKVKNMERLQKI